MNDNERILDEKLERLIKTDIDKTYNVIVTVRSDSGDDIYQFSKNKDRLRKYCEENDIAIINPLVHSPITALRMTGKQITDLSVNSGDYLDHIGWGDEPVLLRK